VRKLIWFVGLAGVAASALVACSGNSATSGSGAPLSRSFAVGPFDSVELQGSDNVRVVTGTAADVAANGSSEILDKLDIRVEGRTLKIGRKPMGWQFSWGSSSGATITVTTPGIVAATVSGSGDMSVDRATGDRFKGTVAGSGALDLADLRVRDAALSLAGSGDLRAVGSAQTASLSVSGSGDIDAERLVSQTVDASLSGSGNLRATAKVSAKVSLAGSGDAQISGTNACAISKVGSGSARCTP